MEFCEEGCGLVPVEHRCPTKPAPIVANDDPVTSHVAAEVFQPTRETRTTQVRDYLMARLDQWVPGHEIASAEVGGEEGKRRFRELEKDGWPVEKRPRATGTGWEYRMLSERPS